MASFPGYSFNPKLPPKTPSSLRLVSENPSVDDVKTAFGKISAHGDLLAARDGKRIRGVRYTKVNIGHLNRSKNHFQGIQRLRGGKHLVISAGDVNEPTSHIFVVRMTSRRKVGAWGTNLLFSSEPPKDDKIVKVIALNKKLWHAGGVSVLGDIVAVGVEGKKSSKVIFLHMADPEKPTRFPFEIDRPNRKATAVGLAKLKSGKFVCAVLWTGNEKRKRLDFYLSKSRKFADGFGERAATWKYEELEGPPDDRNPDYQTINFVWQRSGASEKGALFLVATENTSDAAPLLAGKDRADLYAIHISGVLAGDGSVAQAPRITWVARKELHGKDEYCNMDAAGGLYIDPAGALSLYGAYHWRIDGMIRLSEFRNLQTPARIEKISDGRIELFENTGFEGRRLTILGKTESTIDDYGAIRVQGSRFDDKVSSVRYQLPPGHVYRLYKDKSARDGRPGVDYIDLEGTGSVERLPDLGSLQFGHKVSSSRFVRVGR